APGAAPILRYRPCGAAGDGGRRDHHRGAAWLPHVPTQLARRRCHRSTQRGVMRLLVMTSVPAEAEAVARGLSHEDSQVQVEVGGVGPAIAAASTARLLARAEASGKPYAAVVCAGIAGGFIERGAPVGSTVVAARAVAADLGSDAPDGFIPLAELGFGVS